MREFGREDIVPVTTRVITNERVNKMVLNCVSRWLLSLACVILLRTDLAGQELKSRSSIDDLATRFERGEHDSLSEILARRNEVIPVLLLRAKHPRANVRAAALDLLDRIDLAFNPNLTMPEVIQVMFDAINGNERNDDVVEEALRSLERLNPPAPMPQLINALILQLQRGHERAIPLLGRVGDSTVRGILEPYASKSGRIGERAREALAKLGDERFLREILAQLELEGPRRSDAFRKLAYVRNKSTVRDVAGFLYHPGGPAPVVGSIDVVIYFPYRYEAAAALKQMIDHPPVSKRTTQLNEQDIETWKHWWEAHQAEYP